MESFELFVPVRPKICVVEGMVIGAPPFVSIAIVDSSVVSGYLISMVCLYLGVSPQ